MAIKKIGISCRVTNAINYDEKRDSISHDWIIFFNKLNFSPILIPNKITHIDSFLDEIKIDGIILSGGDNIGDFSERDFTENKLIKYSMEKKLPMLGVCRGMQILNRFFGGDHEENSLQTHVKTHHNISLIDKKFNLDNSETISVNSFHNNLITSKNLAKCLTSFAISQSDGYVEGFFHDSLPIMGVMWHPERSMDNYNELFLKSIFRQGMD
jgi:putative glutamine amidotransferase